tara:strand:- start:783 stop:1778 length:996 start_codon:yes stop_codon:yes gene_type:complete
MGLRKDISWFTPQDTDLSGAVWRSSGYTEVSLSLFEALEKLGQKVIWNAEGTAWHVNYCLPFYYQTIGKKNVGYTPWEYTSIPDTWKYNMEKCDQIWATSSWCKDVYESMGIEVPIKVVPHGIHSDWKVVNREIGEKFYFLHVGGELPRKNSDLVVKAFLELFEGNDDYHLILKVSNRNRVPLPHPQITIIDSFLERDSLISLYNNCHGMVYPITGEGFGMIPFQAIATGMPTICTNETGCSEYADLSMPLSGEWVSVEDYMPEVDLDFDSYGSGAPKAIKPDYEMLVSLMEEVTDDYLDHKTKALRGARIIQNEHSWDSIAERIVENLDL